MSTIKVIDIIRRVEYILQDTGVRWARTELQHWLNEAYLAVVMARPDANASVGALTCVAGSRQNLTTQFSSALRLLDVTRNLASTSKKKVVRVVQRNILDDQRPAWHAETQTDDIEHYMFDPRHPKEFFVYPPAKDTAQLEVLFSDTPDTHTLTESELDPDTGSAEVIKLDDIYMPPIIDWVLYRAYSKDAEHGANEARASSYYQTFSAALGAKSQSDSSADPANASTRV